MGVLSLSMTVTSLLLILAHVDALGQCPELRQVHSCSPKCLQDYDCTGGKVCCKNNCNLKSCVEPAKYNSGSSDKHSNSGGGGIYCNNVKCNSFEVCKLDKSTNRMKCQRS